VNTRLLLAVVVTAILISVLNQTFVNVVVPDIQDAFGATQGQVGWVITGYLLVFAVGIPLYGRIADLYSLRRTFAVGLGFLAAGSLACALAPTLPLLVAGRILQAVGASAIPALGFASVAKALPPGERGTALGLLSSSVGIGAAIGPVVGGAVAGLTGWQVLFYATLVFALILVPPALRVLPGAPEDEDAPAGFLAAIRHFDVPGGLALALAAGLALFGVTEGQVAGFGSPASWVSFVLSGLAAAFFVWRIATTKDPFVSPGLFRNRTFLAIAGVGFFMMFCNVASLVLSPLLLSDVNGLSSGGIGLVLAPAAVAVALLSPIAGRLSDRFGPRLLVRTGLVTIALSTFFVATFATGGSVVLVALGILGQGLGFAAANSPNANAATNVLSRAESGVGLGIYQMLFFLGGGFGTAIGATFLAFRAEAGAGPLNPLHVGGAAAYSDAFMLLTFAALVALVISLGLPDGKKVLREKG
jgi:DHA2 family metal-tetracycline-proton antiporter-like MFS transporter/DHA2 family florfenicol/chloramphenicol resistance protein-like MFS transporter